MQLENRFLRLLAGPLIVVAAMLGLGVAQVEAKRMPGYNPPPLRPATMQAASAGSIVMLTFTAPRGSSDLFVAGLPCGSLNLPWVSVELTSLANSAVPPIVVDLDAPCQKFAAQSITLRPKRPFTVALDLAEWAARKLPTTVLAGRYQAKVTWNFATMLGYHAHHPRMQDTSFTAATAVATVPVVFASSSTADCRKTNNYGDVALLLMQRDPVGQPGVVSVGIFNSGTTTLCVESHIATHEMQDDRLEVTVATRGKPRTAVVVRFTDNRDRSTPVIAALSPGATVWHDLDVVAWAARTVNGSRKLPAAPLTITATYDSTGQDGVWAGTRQATLAFGPP